MIPPDPNSPLRRFERSMVIDYQKWHDGVGYDLDAMREASQHERQAIETLLLSRGTREWRDVEALAALNTSGARAALSRAKHSDHDIAMAVAEYAPHLLSDDERTAMIVRALENAQFYEGLSEALDEAEVHHPAMVIDALLRGAMERDGEAAVHFAALLLFLHGKTDSSFDMAQRPFFLTFNTRDRDERTGAFHELCRRIGRDPEPYIRL